MNKVYEKEEQKTESPIFKSLKLLFDKPHLKANTKIHLSERGVLSVLSVLGYIQDEYRKTYLGLTEECSLSRLVNNSLEFAKSVEGYRSEQVVDVLKSGDINQKFGVEGKDFIDLNKFNK